MRMISLKPHLYAGKRLKAGDYFEARGQGDARLLHALGRAMKAPKIAAIEQPKPVEQPTEKWHWPTPPIAKPDEPEISARTGKPKRTYRTRALKAE